MRLCFCAFAIQTRNVKRIAKPRKEFVCAYVCTCTCAFMHTGCVCRLCHQHLGYDNYMRITQGNELADGYVRRPRTFVCGAVYFWNVWQ